MKLELMAGTTIYEAAIKMCIAASDSGEDVTADFNDVVLIAGIGTTADDIVRQYDADGKKRIEDYKASTKYKIDQRANKKRLKYQAYNRSHLFRLLKSSMQSDIRLLDWLCAAEENGAMNWVRIKFHLEAKGFIKNHGVPGVDKENREDMFRYIVGQCLCGFCPPQVIHAFVQRWKARFLSEAA